MRGWSVGSARASSAVIGAHYYRVGELVAYLHELFAGDPVLSDVWIAGEISDVTQSAAGHTYFTIRDEDGRIPAVMFRSAMRRQTLPLMPGYQALVHGAVDIYDQRSVVQVVADIVLPGDAGRLRAEFEAMRVRLEAEGLFAAERKRPLPRIPRCVGIVTSESGAVLHDMLNIWTRRYRNLELVLAPSLVQGEDAPRQIVAAFRRLHEFHLTRQPLDLVILARGGGSPEELAVFNDERVARAVFACPVPVVSAVGHEVDYTIADLVADVRAPTPSAAAEIVTPDGVELCREFAYLAERIGTAVRRQIDGARAEVAELEQELAWRSPVRVLAERRRDLEVATGRATRAIEAILALARSRVAGTQAQVASLSPLTTLQRGFAVATRDRDGQVLTDARDVDVGQLFTLRLATGAVRGEAVAHLSPDGHTAGEETHAR